MCNKTLFVLVPFCCQYLQERMACPRLIFVYVCSRLLLWWDLQKLYISPPRTVENLIYKWKKRTIKSSRLDPYRHSRGVYKCLVQMFQSSVRVFLGFKTHKTELAELAILSKLQRAVRHSAKGSKHRPEPLFLHLHTRYTISGRYKQTLFTTDIRSCNLPHWEGFLR